MRNSIASRARRDPAKHPVAIPHSVQVRFFCPACNFRRAPGNLDIKRDIQPAVTDIGGYNNEFQSRRNLHGRHDGEFRRRPCTCRMWATARNWLCRRLERNRERHGRTHASAGISLSFFRGTGGSCHQCGISVSSARLVGEACRSGTENLHIPGRTHLLHLSGGMDGANRAPACRPPRHGSDRH